MTREAIGHAVASDSLRQLREAIEAAPRSGAKVLRLGSGAREALALALREGALDRVLVMLELEEPEGTVALRPRTRNGNATVTELLEDDHRRLDALAERMANLASKDPAAAAVAGRAFAFGLRRHIRIEEDVLFPLFESRSGMVGGPTFVMRHEHREIERGLARIENALPRLSEGDPAAAEEARSGLAQAAEVLQAHNAKEERVLYPMTDKSIGPEEIGTVLRRIVLF